MEFIVSFIKRSITQRADIITTIDRVYFAMK